MFIVQPRLSQYALKISKSDPFILPSFSYKVGGEAGDTATSITLAVDNALASLGACAATFSSEQPTTKALVKSRNPDIK